MSGTLPFSPSGRGNPLRLASDSLAAPAPRRAETAREMQVAAVCPDLQPNDPRWILATQAVTELQGAALSPDRRQRLLRLAHHLGMRRFDACMVLAIVQDQARLGRIVQAVNADSEAPRFGPDQFSAVDSEVMNRLRIVPTRTQSRHAEYHRIAQRRRLYLKVIASLGLAIVILTAFLSWLRSG